MGGNALKNCTIRRIEKEEYEKICGLILEKLARAFIKCEIPKAYRSKDSFGDIDIVCVENNMPQGDIELFLRTEFSSKEIVRNSNVYSFEFNNYQIDLILTSEIIFQSMIDFFSWNDLGNLIGRLAHKLGAKYGFDGLVYVYRMEGKVLGEIRISTDMSKICKFLDIDYDKYVEGFHELTEIFEYVTKSKFFNPKLYELESLNRINRERNHKRKTYTTFLKWLEDEGYNANSSLYYRHHPNKDIYLGYIEAHFPGFLAQYMALEDLEHRRLIVKNIINGNLLKEMYGIKGAELGRAIYDFKEYVGELANDGEGYEEFVIRKSHVIFDVFEKANKDKTWSKYKQ